MSVVCTHHQLYIHQSTPLLVDRLHRMEVHCTQANNQHPIMALMAEPPNGYGLTGPVPGFTPGPSHAPQGNPPSDVKIKIPTFDGDKKLYDTWRTSFNVCVDQQPLSPELKLLQLRQYLSGPPLKTVETYGYSAAAYAAALQRLDQKY
eukprot:scpid69314/ scgid5729/ 